MALNAACVWEIRDTGSFNNGGGFNPSNAASNTTDYSQQNSAQYSGTNLAGTNANTASPVITSATHNFVTSDVGNFIHITAGTNWTVGIYEIISVAANAATLDRACATVASPSLGTFAVGGAITFSNTVSDIAITNAATAGNTLWMKKGSYTLGVSVSFATGTGSSMIRLIGYTSSRGDVCTETDRPLITVNAKTITVGILNLFSNLSFTGTGVNTTGIVQAQSGAQCINVKVENTTSNRAFNLGQSTLINCEAISNGGPAIVSNGAVLNLYGCYIHDSDIGFSTASTTSGFAIEKCIFDTFTTAALKITTSLTVPCHISGNTFYGAETPAGIGIDVATGTTGVRLLNNIFYGFTTGVKHADVGQISGYCDYNNFFNNTTNRTNWPAGAHDIALNPSFSNAPGGNFKVGVNMKAAGLGTFPTGLSTGYVDLGAVERQENYPVIGNVRSGTVYSNSELTGTLVTATAGQLKIGVSVDGVTGTYDGSDRWTDPGEANVRLSTAYKANSTSNNKTGLAAIPTAANTKIGIATDQTTGTYDGSDRWTDPTEANVRLGTAYKANSTSNNKNGLAAIPTAANTKIGIATDQTTGTYDGSDRWTDPDQANVRLGIAYKANSTSNNKTGLVAVPSAANTKIGIATDQTIGTYNGSDRWTSPSASDLRSGSTNLKSNSLTTNLSGTLVVPTLSDTKIGVSGDGGTGTYDGSDRWTDPDESNVRLATVYKANSTSNNKSGLAYIPSAADTKIGVSTDQTIGTYDGSDRWSDPGEANVRLATSYKANSTSNNKAGLAAIPTASDTKIGTATDQTTGIYDGSDRWTDPGEANVRLATSYKANSISNNKNGLAAIPTAANTKIGIATDQTTGTYNGSDRWTSPSAGDLRSGSVSLKSNSLTANLSGTLIVPTLANTKVGVAGDGGTGTYDGSDRWTSPSPDELKDGVELKSNSTSLNLTGTYRGEDLYDVVNASELKHDVVLNQDGSLVTGTYRADDLWTSVAPEQLVLDESVLQDGIEVVGTADFPQESDVKHDVDFYLGSQTGTYRGQDLWNTVDASDLRKDVELLQDGENIVGTLVTSVLSEVTLIGASDEATLTGASLEATLIIP